MSQKKQQFPNKIEQKTWLHYIHVWYGLTVMD